MRPVCGRVNQRKQFRQRGSQYNPLTGQFGRSFGTAELHSDTRDGDHLSLLEPCRVGNQAAKRGVYTSDGNPQVQWRHEMGVTARKYHPLRLDFLPTRCSSHRHPRYTLEPLSFIALPRGACSFPGSHLPGSWSKVPRTPDDSSLDHLAKSLFATFPGMTQVLGPALAPSGSLARSLEYIATMDATNLDSKPL